MKKVYIICMLFAISISLFSQERKFEKLIEKYDVAKFLDYNDKNKTGAEFWNAVWENNESFNKYVQALNKKGKLISASISDVAEARIPTELMINELIIQDELQFVVDSVIELMELKKIHNKISTKVYYANYPNAFAVPDGRIFITDSLLCHKDFNFDINYIVGVFAHEFTHFLLQHAFQRTYAIRKKHRTNEIITGVVAAAEIASNAYAQANGAVDNDSWNRVNADIENLSKVAYEDAFGRFSYKYSREQEIEADIIAYRFLEWIGVGGEYYIGVLRALGTEDDIYYSKESEHPTTEFRIKLLEYLAKNR